MQTYSQKLYECKAKQGRDEPPAEQCRMGVSMGYPPLTQKKLILKKILREKFLLWKNSVKRPMYGLILLAQLLFRIKDYSI